MLSYLLAALESEEDKLRFTKLYEENHVRAEQTALRILRDPHDAEDAVQNAFLQVIHHFDEISGIPCKKLGFWIIGDIPEYTITELPEGYVENQEERIATPIQVSILYQSDTGYPITLHYIYIQQGAASQFVLDSTDEVVIDNINGYEAYIFVATDQENDSNAITWIDTQSNIQFTIQAQMSADDLVHMAESVSLCVSPKSK